MERKIVLNGEKLFILGVSNEIYCFNFFFLVARTHTTYSQGEGEGEAGEQR